MKPSIFQGLNISQLDFSHMGTLFLRDNPNHSSKNIDIVPLSYGEPNYNYQAYLEKWGYNVASLTSAFGSIEHGKFNNIIHAHFLLEGGKKIIPETIKYLKPKRVESYTDRRLMKIKSATSDCGFKDQYVIVKGIKLYCPKSVLTIENIGNKQSASIYINKFCDSGLTNFYYQK